MPLIIGYILDLILGDPPRLPHPIRAIGNLISILEVGVRKVFPATKVGERVGGGLLAVLVMAISFAVPFGILFYLYRFNFYLGLAIEALMCYQILAVKSLKTESMKVYYPLVEGDVEKARYNLSMIVGRDTANLTSEEIAKGAVETVAENCADGSVAPMIYMAIGGAPLGFLYKAINTLDSMIGYKNQKYRYFGSFGAKADDVANFIPARLAGVLMTVASAIKGFGFRRSWNIFIRDRMNHASPNSAQTEAACAGALNIRLGGDTYYFGKLYEKKTIGDYGQPIMPDHIVKANQLHYVTAALAMVVSVVIMVVSHWIIWLI